MTAVRDPQRKAFEFLVQRYHSQEVFTFEDLQQATGWSRTALRTYLSKQFRDLLIPVGRSFRIHGVFGQYTNWSKFRDQVVTQNRRLVKDYEPLSFGSVVIFEFFMPLRNEEFLRTALDSLFFKDSVITRLKSADQPQLLVQFPSNPGETKESHLERLCRWISDKFVGYSILHVSGRYRVGELKTQEDVARAHARIAERYLVDETTAVVRFIIPCGKVGPSQVGLSRSLPAQLELSPNRPIEAVSSTKELSAEADRIRWFFTHLFVQRIIEVVAGEDEIWLLESGMRSALHIWRGKG